MSDDKKGAARKSWKTYSQNESEARSEMVDQINKDQYQDELEHKMEVYDNVKATLKLCSTMIRALDATTSFEVSSRQLLIHDLEMGQTRALLAAADVQIEINTVTK